MRVLIAEDDPDIASGLCASMRRQGHVVDHVDNGAHADAALNSTQYALLVLDLGLPQLDGRDVLQRLRQRGDGLAVLVVTARDGLAERVRVLDLGADDYLVKPFALDEFEARVRAQPADAQVGDAVAGDPAQLRAHACFEFVQREGLDQVVVGSQVEHAHALGQAIACGDHQHGQAIAALAQPLQHIAAVQLRQAKVQHQQRVLGGVQGCIGMRAVVHVVDHVALPAHRGAQARGDVRVVFCDEYAHARGSWGRMGRPLDRAGLSAAEGSGKRGGGGRRGGAGAPGAGPSFSPAGQAGPWPAAPAIRPAGRGGACRPR